MVEYKHSLNKGLATCLYKLALSGGGPINLNKLGFTYPQRSNFQKLAYWNLAKRFSPNNPNDIKGGDWIMTQDGWDFIKGRLSMPKSVWSYRGEFVKYEGNKMPVEMLVDDYQYRPEWAEEARPHTQRSLF